MLILYVKTGCPYCAAVLRKLHEDDIHYLEKNILNEEYEQELIKRGGKRQVPYFVDEGRDIEMYESADIIDYLESNYTASEA